MINIIILFLSLSLFKPIHAAAGKVLVIGANGRLGSKVVNVLTSRNIPVRALIRSEPSNDLKQCNNLVETFTGNIANITSLVEATKGCDSVICVHGMKPLRWSKFSDLYTPPSQDPYHPYNVNYIGTKNVIEAMKINNVKKIVRITGSTIGRGELYLFKALFNILLSFSTKWHEATEIAIRESGLNYTILRPNELVTDPPAREYNRSLILTQNFTTSKAGKVSITDIAELCVESVVNPQLSYVTAICTSRPGGDGVQSWLPLVNMIHRDNDILVAKNHVKGVVLLGLILTSFTTIISLLFYKLVTTMFAFITPLIFK